MATTTTKKFGPVSTPAPIISATAAPAPAAPAAVVPSAAPTMTYEEALAQIEALKAENASMKHTNGNGALSCKVTEKGGLSVYGLGKFPVTLYWEQWLKLLDFAEKIRSFITAHKTELKSKGQDWPAKS